MSPHDVATTLAQGAVYLMRHRSVTSPKPHFVVVMNESPDSDVVILLTVVTSKIDNVKRRLQMTGAEHYTAVDLSPKDEPFLSVDSIVNCNDCKECSREDFIADLSSSPDATYIGSISADSLSKMIVAALASNQVKPAQKLMISPQRYAAIERSRHLPEAKRTKIRITVS